MATSFSYTGKYIRCGVFEGVHATQGLPIGVGLNVPLIECSGITIGNNAIIDADIMYKISTTNRITPKILVEGVLSPWVGQFDVSFSALRNDGTCGAIGWSTFSTSFSKYNTNINGQINNSGMSQSEDSCLLVFLYNNDNNILYNAHIAESSNTVVSMKYYGSLAPLYSDIPIMQQETFDIKSWLMGFALGLAGKPLPIVQAKKEPIAYLYGTPSESGNIGLRVGDTVTYYDGIVAADINTIYTDELKVQYPYAHISNSSWTAANPDGLYSLYCFDTIMESYSTKLGSHGDSNIKPVGGDLGTVNAMGMFAIIDETPEFVEPSSNKYGILGQKILWANYDHYHTNGTLLCAATSPIPIIKGIVDYIGDIPIYE